MRGGAIPLLVWGTLLLVLFIGNWIWEAKAINAAEAAFAALVIYAVGVILWLARREAVRRGPPEQEREPEALPEGSLAAASAGISIGMVMFGMVWARFLVFFGAGILLASLVRIGLECREQRTYARQAREPRA